MCWSTMAGVAGPTARVEDVNPEDWDRCVHVCLTSQFNCTRVAVPYLRRSDNASIVNLSSAAGRMGFAMRTPYAAAKWGIIGLTKSLSIEVGRRWHQGQRHPPGHRRRRPPAPCDGSQGPSRKGLSFAEIETEAFSYASIKDYVTAEQLADQILFLASPRGRTISGQALSICGDVKMLA